MDLLPISDIQHLLLIPNKTSTRIVRRRVAEFHLPALLPFECALLFTALCFANHKEIYKKMQTSVAVHCSVDQAKWTLEQRF